MEPIVKEFQHALSVHGIRLARAHIHSSYSHLVTQWSERIRSAAVRQDVDTLAQLKFLVDGMTFTALKSDVYLMYSTYIQGISKDQTYNTETTYSFIKLTKGDCSVEVVFKS